MSSKTSSISRQKNTHMIETIVLVGLCLLLFLAPFFRGLYFESELLPAHIVSFSLAILWLISKYKDNNYKLIKTPIDILAIGVIFMYFISIFYGVNKRLALGEFLKYANYFFIFLLARDLATDETRKKWLLNTIVLSAVGVSLVGIGSAIGTWNYNGAFASNRINSTFQYPNTLASYLGAVFILAIGLTIIEKRRKIKSLYGACSSIMLFTFILTYSRGMWLILPFVLLIFIILIPNKRKIEAIIYLLASAVVSIPLAFLFAGRLGGSSTLLWIMVIALAIVNSFITYLISIIENKLRSFSIKKLMISLMILFVICATLVAYAINSTTSLSLSNTGDEDKWTYITRNIGGIFPNTEYELSVKYSGENSKTQPYIGRVRLYSVDGEGKLEQVEAVNITDDDGDILNIPFTTMENTETIKVYFDNYYTGTTITFDEAKILDTKTKEAIKDIPLKYKYIPESIVARFEGISLEGNSAQARMNFYRDSFKVIKDYPILGTGGGGWVTLYQMYQSYLYWTTQAHNYFLQMWIEIGIVGLGMFVVLLLGLVYVGFNNYRKSDDEDRKLVLTTVGIASIGILSHAFMDFDLSLSALTFVLWMLMGVIYSGYKKTDKDDEVNIPKYKRVKTNNKIPCWLTIAISIVLIISSSFLLAAKSNANKAIAASQMQDIDGAIKYFEKASKLDPFKAEYKSDLSTFNRIKFQQTKDQKYLRASLELARNAVKLAPYNSQVNFATSSTYMNTRNIDEALDLAEKAVQVHPMRVENYVQKCDGYLAAFYYYIEQGEYDKAEKTIEEAYKVKEQIKEINNIALRPLSYNDDLLYKIGTIQFNYENLKNREYAIPEGYSLDLAYYFDLDINKDGMIDKLANWSSEDMEIQYKLMNDAESSFIRITNDGENFGIVYPYGLKLEPDTNYKTYFKARGTTKDGTFKFYVYDNQAKDKNQGELKGIKLDDKWNIYELDIHTDEDIVPGTQYFRFQHNGSDEGYVDVEEVIIFKGN